MDSPSSAMDYEGMLFFYQFYSFNKLSLDELAIELPNNIWEPMVDLHRRMLTAIPKKRRSYWSNKVDEFCLLYFKNNKLK
jgi:hypothetical protein